MRKILLLFALFNSFTPFSFAQTKSVLNKVKLDSLFDTLEEKDKAMLSFAILQDGKPIYSKATGYSKITGSTKIASTTETRYRIGSISKVFTGTMIFQLIEEGKLSLNTPLAKYFPSVTNATKITVANLLNHSSGLYNFTNDTTYQKTLDKKVTEADMLAAFRHEPNFEPGAKHEYSNTNFVLLGFIIEKLDKTSYAKALKARITDKTGLKNTYYGGKIGTLDKEANSFNWASNWVPATETDMSIPGGAGALVSTPLDLVKFFNDLFNGKLINSTSLTEMKKMDSGYGMAMFEMPFYEKKGFGHNGGIDGFQSQALIYPENNLAIAAVTNGINFSLNKIMIGALSILFDRNYTIPSFNPIALTSAELDKYLGVYISDKLPVKITITKKETVLLGQVTGQPAFTLEASNQNNEFTFEPAGVLLIFDSAKNQMVLKQNGAEYVMSREK